MQFHSQYHLLSTAAYGSVVPHVDCPVAGEYKWVNESGNFATNQWVYAKIISSIDTPSEGWMYFGADGVMKTGWFQAHDGYWYYCDNSGKMQYNTTIDGKYKLDYKEHWIIPEKY